MFQDDSQKKTAITSPEVVQLLERLQRIISFETPADRSRFKTSVVADVHAYQAERDRLHSGRIGNAIEHIYKLAFQAEAKRTNAYERLAQEISGLHQDVRAFLRSRHASHIRLPLAEELLIPNKREEAVRNLLSDLRIGEKIVRGRNRPRGKQSKSLVPLLWKPTSGGPGRKSKFAEEWFVVCLSISYNEATGRRPPAVAHYNSRSPFVTFVEECFEAVGIATPHSSAVRAINEVGRTRPAKS